MLGMRDAASFTMNLYNNPKKHNKDLMSVLTEVGLVSPDLWQAYV